MIISEELYILFFVLTIIAIFILWCYADTDEVRQNQKNIKYSYGELKIKQNGKDRILKIKFIDKNLKT